MFTSLVLYFHPCHRDRFHSRHVISGPLFFFFPLLILFHNFVVSFFVFRCPPSHPPHPAALLFFHFTPLSCQPAHSIQKQYQHLTLFIFPTPIFFPRKNFFAYLGNLFSIVLSPSHKKYLTVSCNGLIHFCLMQIAV